jgi:hypothetical protein
MTAISLGSYTFAMNPTDMSMLKPKRVVQAQETVTGIQTLSFGMFYAGQVVTLKWNYIPVAVWIALLSLEDDDAGKVFVPGDGHTYNVQIMRLHGEYFIDQAASATWRKNVELTLVIESLVS